MTIQELRKRRIWENKRSELLRETLKDAKNDGMTYVALSDIMGEQPSNICNFIKGDRLFSPEKIEYCLNKCGIK